MTKSQQERAKKRKKDVSEGRAKPILSLPLVEKISAVTGLMTMQALNIIGGEKSQMIPYLEAQISNLVPFDYQGSVAKMLEEMQSKDDDTSLLNAAVKRINRILGRATPIVSRITEPITRSMVNSLSSQEAPDI